MVCRCSKGLLCALYTCIRKNLKVSVRNLNFLFAYKHVEFQKNVTSLSENLTKCSRNIILKFKNAHIEHFMSFEHLHEILFMCICTSDLKNPQLQDILFHTYMKQLYGTTYIIKSMEYREKKKKRIIKIISDC